jgi:hypothetical protein
LKYYKMTRWSARDKFRCSVNVLSYATNAVNVIFKISLNNTIVMKPSVLILFASLSFVGCNNSSDQPSPEKDSSTITETVSSWKATLNDSTQRLEMKKDTTMGPDSLSVPVVISFLNSNNQHVQLQFVNTSGDTIYIKIPEATYLTQQMGSTGPTYFFANAVYNMTEVPGYKYVNFDFEEGDHASPGTYNRDSFKDE